MAFRIGITESEEEEEEQLQSDLVLLRCFQKWSPWLCKGDASTLLLGLRPTGVDKPLEVAAIVIMITKMALIDKVKVKEREVEKNPSLLTV